MGRPRSTDSDLRRAKFLCLIADGQDPVAARKAARIDPDRALVIACEATFNDVVRAIKASGEPVAVVVAPGEQDAAKAA